MAKLKFKQDDKGNDTKVALGMFSKDGEYVDLDKECDLGGQVSSKNSSTQKCIKMKYKLIEDMFAGCNVTSKFKVASSLFAMQACV